MMHQVGDRPRVDPLGGAEHGAGDGKINPLPLFGTDAGLRPTVSFFCGHSPPEFTTAARTRSRLSIRLLSGSPTSVKAATPGSRSAWTSTTTPSTPTSATEHARAKPIRPPPARARPRARPCRGSSTPIRSMRTPPGGAPPSAREPAPASRLSRSTFSGVTAAIGCSNDRLCGSSPRRGPACPPSSPGHDVDLAGPAAPPVPRQDGQPGLGQQSRGEILAVPPQCPRAFISAPPPVPTVTRRARN